MNRATVEEQAVRERLDHLERRTQWLSALAMLLAILCVSLLAWQFAPLEPVVEAQGFVVRDSRWRMLAELKGRQDGTPVLRLIGDSGHPAAMLHMDAKGSVALRLNDPLGHKRAELRVDREGAPSLVLSDEDGHARAVLAVNETDAEGGPRLVLRDGAGRAVWSAPGPTPAQP